MLADMRPIPYYYYHYYYYYYYHHYYYYYYYYYDRSIHPQDVRGGPYPPG